MNLFRQLLFGLAVGGLIALACDRASGQSCGTSYSRGYSRGATYSYAAPAYSSYSTYSYSTPTMSYAAPAYVAPTAYEAPVVKKEVSYLRFLAVLPLVELPSYSAVYTPPPPPAQQQQNGTTQRQAQAADPQAAAILDQLRGLNEGLTRLDRKVGQIDARLERLERTPRGPIQQQAPAPPPPPPPPPAEPGPQPDKEPAKAQQQTKAAGPAAAFAAANKASCAACHQGKEVADAHGGGFVFTELDGTLAKLDSKQVLSVQRQLTTGKMPKVDSARARAMGVVAPTQQQADAIFKRLDEYVLTMTE